jgi:lysophospholipase L1-like esterase
MQATHGFARFCMRRGSRLVGCLLALVALTAMVVAPSVASAAGKKEKTAKRTYLALGDSLAFGYSQQLFNETEKLGAPPTAFEHGYTNDYLGLINAEGKLQLVNNGCPGETSESFIGSNATLLEELNAKLARAIATPVTGEEPCEYHRAFKLPLHHEYGGSKSQLESAIATIAQEKAEGKAVKVLTLNIGANDELHALKKVEKEATARIEAEVAGIAQGKVTLFVLGIAKEEVAAYVAEQVRPQAEEETKGEEPAFSERIKALSKEYESAHGKELNELTGKDAGEYAASHQKELEELGVKLGHEYAAAHAAELKAEGEKFGKELLAKAAPALFEQIVTNIKGIIVGLRDGSAFGGVNYTGKIIFQGGYNPFGNVYGKGEIEEGSNALAEQLNLLVQGSITKTMKLQGFRVKGACFVNPHPKWNPGGTTEPELLSKWTNMANFTEFEGKKNGPDIHPTPEGYAQLAKEMKEACAA